MRQTAARTPEWLPAPQGASPALVNVTHPSVTGHGTKLGRCGHIGPAAHQPGSWVSERTSAVIKSSSPDGQGKARHGPASWLAARLRAAGDRLFAEEDRKAREHGWEVTCRHGGLSRRYRDPRFDTLTSCPWCHGSGQAGEHQCPACRGTGRLCRGQPPQQEGGDGDEEPFAQAQ